MPTDSAAAQAVSAAMRSFRFQLGNDADGLVADATGLASTVAPPSFPLGAARSAYLRAQGAMDALRQVLGAESGTVLAMDALSTDLPPGQWHGLHRIEQILWAHSLGSDDREVLRRESSDLVAEARTAQYELSALHDTPSAIVQLAEDDLGWIDQCAVPGGEERFSHDGTLDVRATADAAMAAYGAVAPLVQLIDPGDGSRLAGMEASLGQDLSNAPTGTATAHQVDVVAALMAVVEARLSDILSQYRV